MNIKTIAITVLVLFLVYAGYKYFYPKYSTMPITPEQEAELQETLDTPVTDSVEETKIYDDYSEEETQQLLDNGSKVVLFFHAGWCPTCIAANEAFESDDIGRLPSEIYVRKIDYDSDSPLIDKYNVTYQHTFVQINKDLEAVNTWNGGEIDTLLQNVK